MRNPIRAYVGWQGKNLVEIASEPAGKAIAHYGKVAMSEFGLGVLAGFAMLGIGFVGYKINEKIKEMKEAK